MHLVLFSDCVENSYGESRGSSCEKSQSPGQNLRVPVKKITSPYLKILGPLCIKTRHVVCKTDSKTLYNSRLKLKFSPSILKHNKGVMKYASLTIAIIGSLRCHDGDGDGNENVQKAVV